MFIMPTLVLTEDDLKPYLEAFKKQLKEEEREFRIESIVPVTTGDGKWTVEIKAVPVT